MNTAPRGGIIYSGAKALLVCLFAGSFLHAGPASAGGPVHGARAAGMGTAFVGVADDPSAIFHNPGGLSQVRGTQVYGGAVALSPSTSYRAPGGEEVETEARIFLPPHLFLSSDLGLERLVLGIGLYSTFGIGGRTWDGSGPLRHLSTESTVGTLTVNPTVACRVLPSLAVAVGVDLMRSRFEAARKVDQSLVGAPDASTSTDAEGVGWGYNLGLLWNPVGGFRLGAAYRSGIAVDHEGALEIVDIAPSLQPLFGGARFTSPLETSSSFPEIVGVGASFEPLAGLRTALDVEVVRWSSFDRAEIRLGKEVAVAGVTSAANELAWRDSWQYKFGFEYALSEAWTLRGGYAYVTSPVPERTLAPDNPDANQHNVSLGAGFRWGRLTADAFYNAGLFERRKVENAILSGEYVNTVHYLGLSLGHRL